MKKYILITLIVAVCSIAKAQISTDNYNRKLSIDVTKEIETINIYDTVVFDFANAVITGNYLDIPVSIISDDVVNALDFQLTYNHTNLLYVTILNNTSYLSMTEYYNQADETIRFTSNSFTTYENNPVVLVFIRFQLLTQQATQTDITPVLGLLNGDPCTRKLTDADITVGINNPVVNDFALVYPNPANESLTVQTHENASVQLADISGRTILLESTVYANQKHELNIQNIPSGIYLLKFYSDKTVSTQKLVITG